MELSLSVTKKEGILFIEASGTIKTISEYKELQMRYFEAILEGGSNTILIDTCKLQFPKGILDQVDIVEFYQEDAVFPGIRLLRVAILAKLDDKSIASFWEDYSVNRGFNFRVFYQQDKAKDWLLSE